MQLHSFKFGVAAALATAVIWIICSILVFSFPELTMMASGDMMHMDTGEMMWSLTLSGFVKGLIIWSLSVGLTAWIFAAIYNRL